MSSLISWMVLHFTFFFSKNWKSFEGCSSLSFHFAWLLTSALLYISLGRAKSSRFIDQISSLNSLWVLVDCVINVVSRVRLLLLSSFCTLLFGVRRRCASHFGLQDFPANGVEIWFPFVKRSFVFISVANSSSSRRLSVNFQFPLPRHIIRKKSRGD